MNRKTFIRQSALAATGMALLPHLLDNRHRTGLVLGHNNKRYTLDTKWGTLQAQQYPVKDCHEMVQDSKGRILLLTNETKNNILVYDKKGTLVTTWGNEYPGGHGLSIFDENGTDVLFIADNNRNQVIKTSIEGKVLLTLDYPKDAGIYDKATEFVPTETAVAPNGDIYIADGYGKDYIIQYNYKGEYIRHWGGSGNEDHHLKNAHGICYDNRDKNNPTLIVSSRQQQAFKRYTLDGQYINTIPLPGAWVCRPVIKGDYLYAAVLMSHVRPMQQSGFITILDKNDRVVSNIAGSEPTYNNGKLDEMYQTIRAFQYPHDVCVDDEDNLYVAQWNSGQKYPFKLKLLFCLLFFVQMGLSAQDTFQLAPPILQYNSIFFDQKTSVTIKFAQPQTQIRYTLDNTVPTEKDALYTGPVEIKKNLTTLKARVFGPQFLPSETEDATFIQTGIHIEAIEITPPNPKYPGVGTATLTDGIGGKTNLADNTWLGYNNDTAVITLHLGKKQRVRQVLLNFLQNEGSWIFLPQSIHIAYRDTKTGKLIPLGSELIPPDQPNKDTQCHPKTIKAPRKCQTDRLIITICPLAKMPEWHTAKGEHAWTFLDEVIVY